MLVAISEPEQLLPNQADSNLSKQHEAVAVNSYCLMLTY